MLSIWLVYPRYTALRRMERILFYFNLFLRYYLYVLYFCLEMTDLLAFFVSDVFVTFPFSVLLQVWYLILSITGICLLPYLLTLIFYRSVADQLRIGQTVKPEAYESVSVYFSDIVGFTSISAICTPFQVLYSD